MIEPELLSYRALGRAAASADGRLPSKTIEDKEEPPQSLRAGVQGGGGPLINFSDLLEEAANHGSMLGSTGNAMARRLSLPQLPADSAPWPLPMPLTRGGSYRNANRKDPLLRLCVIDSTTGEVQKAPQGQGVSGEALSFPRPRISPPVVNSKPAIVRAPSLQTAKAGPSDGTISSHIQGTVFSRRVTSPPQNPGAPGPEGARLKGVSACIVHMPIDAHSNIPGLRSFVSGGKSAAQGKACVARFAASSLPVLPSMLACQNYGSAPLPTCLPAGCARSRALGYSYASGVCSEEGLVSPQQPRSKSWDSPPCEPVRSGRGQHASYAPHLIIGVPAEEDDVGELGRDLMSRGSDCMSCDSGGSRSRCSIDSAARAHEVVASLQLDRVYDLVGDLATNVGAGQGKRTRLSCGMAASVDAALEQRRLQLELQHYDVGSGSDNDASSPSTFCSGDASLDELNISLATGIGIAPVLGGAWIAEQMQMLRSGDAGGAGAGGGGAAAVAESPNIRLSGFVAAAAAASCQRSRLNSTASPGGTTLPGSGGGGGGGAYDLCSSVFTLPSPLSSKGIAIPSAGQRLGSSCFASHFPQLRGDAFDQPLPKSFSGGFLSIPLRPLTHRNSMGSQPPDSQPQSFSRRRLDSQNVPLSSWVHGEAQEIRRRQSASSVGWNDQDDGINGDDLIPQVVVASMTETLSIHFTRGVKIAFAVLVLSILMLFTAETFKVVEGVESSSLQGLLLLFWAILMLFPAETLKVLHCFLVRTGVHLLGLPAATNCQIGTKLNWPPA